MQTASTPGSSVPGSPLPTSHVGNVGTDAMGKSDYGIETFLGIPLLALIVGIVYSFVIYHANFEPLFIGPVLGAYLAIVLPAKLISVKKGITRYGKVLAVGVVAVFLLFIGNYVTHAYLLYQDFLKEEITYEHEEDIYVSDVEAQQFLDDALLDETGYSSYVGAFVWYLQNTEITNDKGNSPQSIGLTESLGIEGVSILLCLLSVLLGIPREIKKSLGYK